MMDYDYIIIGTGSAGCVLADRLSRNGCNRVLALEAGGSDRRASIKLPIGYGKIFFDENINWKYETESDPACKGRKGYWPRGKVLGGSSSINALIHCWGLPSDFDDWRDAGATGWGWDHVRPHFECIESWIASDGTITGDGPLYVSDVSDRAHPANGHYFEAARELGFAFSENFNGLQPEGVGYYRLTTRNGMRWSAADAFLRPAMRRRNVTLMTHTCAERVIFERRRAVGVDVLCEGRRMRLRARKEVIVSAGAVNSPQLLQLSGIGPGALLHEHDIGVLSENPNVGGGLQDHLAVSYYYKATEPTVNNELAPWRGKLWAGIKYVLTQRGPLSLSVNQCGGFVRSSPSAERPDMQLYFNPLTYTTAPVGKRPLLNPDPFAGFLISFQPARPSSRGRIDIRSPDIHVAPRIKSSYLSTQKDLEDVVAGGRLIQRMVRTAGLRRLIAEAIPPDLDRMNDSEIVEDFRLRASTVFHPVSTCAMGRDQNGAVVDPDLKVFGVEGLRVVDASVFPNITSGNINAPVLMLAHKAADAILRDA